MSARLEGRKLLFVERDQVEQPDVGGDLALGLNDKRQGVDVRDRAQVSAHRPPPWGACQIVSISAIVSAGMGAWQETKAISSSCSTEENPPIAVVTAGCPSTNW